MPGYWRFFRSDTPLLTYGLSLTFVSSFGQTFLISLFVPFILVDFSLTNGEFGVLYSLATLGSAMLLPWAGQWLDRANLILFTLAVMAGMAASAFLLAVSGHLVVLGLALLGLRLSGQGLSSHTALTAMARYYRVGRGKALSISSLGFPVGEAVLPLAVAGAIAMLGWRQSWAVVGAMAAILFGPFLVVLLRRSGVEVHPEKAARKEAEAADAARSGGDVSDEGNASGWRRGEVVRDPRFWFVLPAALLPPFWATGLFLYQTRIAEVKGWSLALMASAFAAFAVTRIAFSLATGGAVDRLSARHVFPFSPLPMGVGLALLMFFGGPWVAYAFMACLGVTMGMSGTTKSALWAELSGIEHLGAIKSMMAALMVVSTAASPTLVGMVLDADGGLEGLLLGGLVSVAAGVAMALRVFPRSA